MSSSREFSGGCKKDGSVSGRNQEQNKKYFHGNLLMYWLDVSVKLRVNAETQWRLQKLHIKKSNTRHTQLYTFWLFFFFSCKSRPCFHSLVNQYV